MKFNVFYCENYLDAPFDLNNPRCVMESENVQYILSSVCLMPPYFFKKDEFGDLESVGDMINIGVLKEKNGRITLDAPVFIKKDIDELKRLSYKTAKVIADIIVSKHDEISEVASKVCNSFSKEINLYHLMCGKIFDGMMFDFLEEEKIVTTSKLHPSGLDYLLVAYEDDEELSKYSNSLLCSFNRLNTSSGTFSSFGDADGDRKDLYRFLRRREGGKLTEDEKLVELGDVEDLGKAMLDLCEGKSVSDFHCRVLEYFDYVHDGKVCVPVFDDCTDGIVQELFDLIIDDIKLPLIDSLVRIGNSSLMCVSHGVEVRDIANEIYHLIFGEVNELLVKSGMVAKPETRAGEGRYFKCFEK